MNTQAQVFQHLALYWGMGAIFSAVLLSLWFKFMGHVHYVYRYNQTSDSFYQIRRISYWFYVVFLCGMCGCLAMALYELFQAARAMIPG